MCNDLLASIVMVTLEGVSDVAQVYHQIHYGVAVLVGDMLACMQTKQW